MKMFQVYRLWIAAISILVAGEMTQPSVVRAEALAVGFASPPASARPWVYWFWINGNLSREGITADLEAMSKAGIGGMIIMEVDVGIAAGPVKFMSDEWRALFKHAVTEAERLGLEIALNAGPGWTGSGGPWVRPEQSMQHVVASVMEVAGPSETIITLKRPEARAPHFVHAPMPAVVAKVHRDFYRDVAILAFPSPVNEAKITDSDEKAMYYRLPYSSHPGVKPFLVAPATFPAVPAGTAIPRDRIVDVSEHLSPDGRLSWKVPEGRWTIMRFGRTTTGANTRPAPRPAIGLECDKFDKAALSAHFDAYIGMLMSELGPKPRSRKSGWTMLHIDSWEMGAQNWTANFREEFRQRRGYDPLPYLPAVTGRVVDNHEISERFLWDLRQTGSELIIENHAEHLKTLAHRHGFGLSIEPYDLTPCADLELGGVADVPMCEFWSKGYGFDTSFSCMEAVSAAHTRGRTIVAAEAFTADAEEAWQLYPGNMKTQADWAFCIGVNRLVFHRYAHQPWLNRFPGMTMGPYGVHYEHTQTWWGMVGAWHDYLSRCQFMLRRGLPVADICYLTAEGAPHVFRPPASALQGSQPVPDRRGYNFDGCAPSVLERMKVEHGQLVLPEGTSYRLLVLPNMETMTPKLLSRVKTLIEAGAAVVGRRPLKSPSLTDYPDCDARVQRMAEAIWGESTASEPKGRQIGKGKLINGTNGDYRHLAALLADMGIPPDFESDLPVRYTHRRDGETDIYFVANGGAVHVETHCAFRATGRVPQIWDPVSGDMLLRKDFEEKDGRTYLTLSLAPQGSAFVVFERTPSATARNDRRWSAGKSIGEVAGPWEVSFQPGRGAPKRVSFDTLTDWSKHQDEGVKHFSGEATYKTAITIHGNRVNSSERLYLDLGRVEVMARVKFNGHDLGVVWTPPFSVDVTKAAREGTNVLEVTVANLWPNRLIGEHVLKNKSSDLSLTSDSPVVWTTWNPFKKNSQLLTSGLLGPVVLRAVD